MQIVIIGMLSYTIYVMLFPEGQYAHYDERKKRSASIIYDDLRDHFSHHKGPIIDNLALFVNKGARGSNAFRLKVLLRCIISFQEYPPSGHYHLKTLTEKLMLT